MTAQSCVDDDELLPPMGSADRRVVAGITNIADTLSGQVRQVDAIARHPQFFYNDHEPHYNLALLHLASPLDLTGPNARAIPLVTAEMAAAGATAPGVTAIVSGWGLTESGGSSAQLQAVALPITNESPLLSEISAGGNGLDACYGDGGGPLTVVVDGTPHLAGIVSYGYGCGDGGRYARVSEFDDWIASVATRPVNQVLKLTGLAGDQGSFAQRGSFTIPSGMTTLSVMMQQDVFGDANNASLYVRRGAPPTTSDYDCAPKLAGSNEACTWDHPLGGTYFVAIKDEATNSPLDLTANVIGAMNLAAGATVRARSSFEDADWSIHNLVDGNANSVSGAMGYSSKLYEYTNHTEWLMLTFETPRPVSGVVLHPRNDPGNEGQGFPHAFKIQIWDGANWIDRVTVPKFSTPTTPQLFKWSTPDLTSQIRIYATSLDMVGAEYLLQFAEVEIYDPAPPSITTGATAFASSAYTGSPGWATTKLVDHTRSSVAGGMGHSSQLFQYTNHTEWVEVRLPSQRRFSSITLYPRSDTGMVGEGFPVDFKIQVWDGANWLDRVAVTDYPKPGNSGQVFTWGFHDVTDRIRIYATKLRPVGTDYLLQLAEVEINDLVVVPNLAAGSYVYASSDYTGSPGWAPRTVSDGITSSVAGSMGHSSQLFQYADHTEWVELSLPSIRTFSGIALHPRNDAGMIGEGFPVAFQLQVWDGANWLTRVAETGFAKPGNAAQIFRWGFSDTTDRVRVNATSLRPVGGDYLLQLAELRVLE